jgi:hypothetical protein
MMPSSSAGCWSIREISVGGDYFIEAVDVGSWEAAFKMLAQRRRVSKRANRVVWSNVCWIHRRGTNPKLGERVSKSSWFSCTVQRWTSWWQAEGMRNEGTIDIKNTMVIIRIVKIVLSDVQVIDMVLGIDVLRVPFHISSKENMGISV